MRESAWKNGLRHECRRTDTAACDDEESGHGAALSAFAAVRLAGEGWPAKEICGHYRRERAQCALRVPGLAALHATSPAGKGVGREVPPGPTTRRERLEPRAAAGRNGPGPAGVGICGGQLDRAAARQPFAAAGPAGHRTHVASAPARGRVGLEAATLRVRRTGAKCDPEKRALTRRLKQLPVGGRVLALDETTLRHLPPLRAAWALRARQAEVPISGQNARRTLFATVDLRNGRRVLKNDLAANRQFVSIHEQARCAESWVRALRPVQTLRKAGLLSKDCWLKEVRKILWHLLRRLTSKSMKLSDSSSNAAELTPLPGAQPASKIVGTRIGHLRRVAAGFPALYQNGRFTLRKMGIRRGLSTWTKVNQKQGFDGQSCAWPSPDHHRHVFEFCENGVKAIADEATTKRTSPKFFRRHRILDLNEATVGLLARTTGKPYWADGETTGP
jgi:hypothetical protein